MCFLVFFFLFVCFFPVLSAFACNIFERLLLYHVNVLNRSEAQLTMQSGEQKNYGGSVGTFSPAVNEIKSRIFLLIHCVQYCHTKGKLRGKLSTELYFYSKLEHGFIFFFSLSCIVERKGMSISR